MASSSANDVSYGTHITNNNDYATPVRLPKLPSAGP